MAMRHQMIQSSWARVKPMPQSEVQDLLSQVARGVTSGDGHAVAMLWEVPAVIISADGVTPVTSREQLASWFGGAKRDYNERGIVDTRADILDEDWIGDRLVVAGVRWPYIDANLREVGAEASDYTLRRQRDGRLRICSVLMRGVEAKR
jgi:hypothetical protein